MKIKKPYLYLSLFGIHFFIAIVAFLHFRLHPDKVLFSSFGDGLKNIFTLTTYVREPITNEGILKSNAFLYPFGDYVYYLDNTPLFSIPFRFFCQHIYDVSAYTVQIFYVILILNILFAGLLTYYLMRNIVGDNIIAFLMAVILPWVNMQVARLYMGHYAFSLSSLLLLCICLQLLWHRHINNRRKVYIIAACMCLLSFFSFLAQGYYLAIVTIFQSSMLFFYGLARRKEYQGKFSMVASAVCSLVVMCMVGLLLFSTDKYLPLRRENPNGYDWMEMKTRFSALFTHYSFQNIVFPFWGRVDDELEKSAYLGNVGLYTVLVFGIGALLSKSFRAFMTEVQKRFFGNPFRKAMVLGGLVLLSISFGEYYYTETPSEKGWTIINLTNIFFYIHYFTKRVEQFRCITRFLWPFYYVFNIWAAYILVAVYQRYSKGVKVAIACGVLFLGGAELYDCTNRDQKFGHEENVFSTENLEKVRPKNIDWRRYQAILPLPYYTVGSEEFNYILDDDDNWSNYSYRLAMISHLPLMSCKMSRTPLSYTRMLLNFVAYDSLDAELQKRLNEKPVLIALNRKEQTDSASRLVPHEEVRANYYWRALHFADRNHLQPVDSLGDVVYYEWYPPKRG